MKFEKAGEKKKGIWQVVIRYKGAHREQDKEASETE